MGVALSPGPEVGPHDLMRKADVAMHAAKAGGKGRIEPLVDLETDRIELADQVSVLRSWGCDTGQGYLFSPALPGELVLRWIASAAGDSEPYVEVRA